MIMLRASMASYSLSQSSSSSIRTSLQSLRASPASHGTVVRLASSTTQLGIRLGCTVPGSASSQVLSFARRRRLNTTVTTCSAVGGDNESAVVSTVPWNDEVSRYVQPFLQLARVADIRWVAGPWWFVVAPFWWGAGLAVENGSGPPDLGMLAIFTVASAILHCAICTVNDVLDKDFDRQVERTKLRPVAAGTVTPFQGWIFFGAQYLLYLVVLSQLEAFSVWSPQLQVLLALQLFLNVTYPLAKRWTHWTAVYLGVAINWSVFLGWAAVRGTGDLASPILLPVFFAACCWNILLDTIYCHQDKHDDPKAGVKSLAILFGEQTKPWLTGFALAFVASLSIAGHFAAIEWPFYVGVAGAAAHLAWQLASVDLDNPDDCQNKFFSNKWVGAILFGGIACAKLLT